MTAIGYGTVDLNPPQDSIKQREKCGLAARSLFRFDESKRGSTFLI